MLFDRFRDRIPAWLDGNDLERHLRALFLNQASDLARATGQRSAPFDPVPALFERGVHVIMPVRALEQEALLVPDEEGFALWLRKGAIGSDTLSLSTPRRENLRPRVRTTLAHELGHTFFYDISSRPPRASVSNLTVHGRRELETKEEWWCMDFARAFLIPDTWASRHLKTGDFPSFEEATELRERLAVTWDILFRRLIWDLRLWRHCAIAELDMRGGSVRRLWKSPESRGWSMNRWYNEIGRDVVVSTVGRLTRWGEKEVETHLVDGAPARLIVSGSRVAPRVLVAVCFSHTRSLDSFAA
ncbi:MAG TPA: hypothetical protein VGR51_07205 [Thermoplasmata archaeon]|nr:hypothetical protein [Thermoplasmata archaeon]